LVAPAVTRSALVLGILRAPATVRRARKISLALLASDGGRVTLRVRRAGGKGGKLIAKTVPAGRSSIAWTPARSSVGRYRLTVTIRSADGRTATDSVTVRIMR
jgi:hypothetical protein